MSRYIQQIVDYFFHHDVKGEIATKVQQRIALGGDDADGALRRVWVECDEVAADDAKTEEAFTRLSSALMNDDEEEERFPWMKMVAIWLAPVIMLGASAYFYFSATEKEKLYSGVVFVHKFDGPV